MNYKKKSEPSRFMRFFADRGFYIILILCVAAIGISGYVLFFSDTGSENPSHLAELPATPPPARTPTPEIPLIEALPEGAVRDTKVVMATPAPSAKPEEPAEKEPADAVAVVGSTILEEQDIAPSFFVWPLNGQTLKEYHVDELVKSATMGDWRVHTGLDIGANRGTQVMAIADGTVEDIYTDEMMGVTVVLEHGGGMKSVYRNLNENPPVDQGDRLKAGDVLGAVGNTAAEESLDSPHLHLELLKDGARVNPIEYLPNR